MISVFFDRVHQRTTGDLEFSSRNFRLSFDRFNFPEVWNRFAFFTRDVHKAQAFVCRITLELGGKSPNVIFADADSKFWLIYLYIKMH